jgi:hypothetical protein
MILLTLTTKAALGGDVVSMPDLYFPKLVAAKLPSVTAWSYTRYADYRRCPMFFAYKHLLKIKEPAGPALQRGRDIHGDAERYLSAKRKPKLPATLRNFAERFEELRGLSPTVEQQWGFTKDWTPTEWFGKDVWVRNVLDACVTYEDNTGDVIDHKTGKKYGGYDEQMELFAVSTFAKFPELTHVTTRLWFLDIEDKNEQEVLGEFTAKEVPALKKDWTKRVAPMFIDRKFPPRPNDKCRWCFLSRAKGGPCKF